MRYRSGHAIIIGLSGEAGSGKTVSATAVVPSASISYSSETDMYWWDHKFLAMPLYEMARIRRDIAGQKAEERMKYELHRVLLDLFGHNPLYGMPDYDVLYELVYDILHTPIPGDPDVKPRSFLQQVGSLCREADPDVFAKWIIRSIKKDSAHAEEQDMQYVCYVSDIRMPNEAKIISEQPNGVVIRLDASDSVRKQRLLDRDGSLMTEEQAGHISERVNDIPAEYFSCRLNTDDLSVSEQAQAIIRLASDNLGVELSTYREPETSSNA